MNEILEVIKRGETSLTVSLERSPSGLTLSVKAHPVVEAFIRGLGKGEVSDVRVSGPYWRPLGKEGPPLMVHGLTDTVPDLVLDSGDSCSISRIGHPILETYMSNSGQMKTRVNLSFLRLVGISEGPGISFAVRGVHTYEQVTKMKEQIGEGYKRFYRTYMKPVRMDIIVSTQETAL